MGGHHKIGKSFLEYCRIKIKGICLGIEIVFQLVKRAVGRPGIVLKAAFVDGIVGSRAEHLAADVGKRFYPGIVGDDNCHWVSVFIIGIKELIGGSLEVRLLFQHMPQHLVV